MMGVPNLFATLASLECGWSTFGEDSRGSKIIGIGSIGKSLSF